MIEINACAFVTPNRCVGNPSPVDSRLYLEAEPSGHAKSVVMHIYIYIISGRRDNIYDSLNARTKET